MAPPGRRCSASSCCCTSSASGCSSTTTRSRRSTTLRGDDKNSLIYATAAAVAYGLGLRHAFDADHIAAIDDTTRYLLQKGKRPLGVGFFFSLGHSSVVMALSVAIAFAARSASGFITSFQGSGNIIGTLVSGGFLYLIAALNFAVLFGIMKMWRQAKSGTYKQEELDVLLSQRGFMNRIFKGRYNTFITASWQMYPVGILFGLGFDTATEVGFLGLAATTAAAGTGGGTTLPPLAIIALPFIFAAGMSLMDTIDGVFMSKAYGWAFVTPIRKIYYNITMTSLSIFIAFVIGTIEIVGLLTRPGRLDRAAVGLHLRHQHQHRRPDHRRGVHPRLDRRGGRLQGAPDRRAVRLCRRRLRDPAAGLNPLR